MCKYYGLVPDPADTSCVYADELYMIVHKTFVTLYVLFLDLGSTY